ncbi:hypothetical protein P3T40_006596 [Paraburkholderia sp. EB58]|jgi:hypothetical protein
MLFATVRHDKRHYGMSGVMVAMASRVHPKDCCFYS